MEMCKVSFTIGKNYNCEVLCKAIDMDVCNLILAGHGNYMKVCGMTEKPSLHFGVRGQETAVTTYGYEVDYNNRRQNGLHISVGS